VTLDNYGMFFYIRDVQNDEVWTSTFAPGRKKPDEYKVEFTSGKQNIQKRRDIDTLTEIVVCAGENAEIEVYFGKSRTGKLCDGDNQLF